MGISPKTLRILGASVLAVFLVVGAYAVSGPNPLVKFANAQSSEQLLKEYAAKDSDNDGLPDWQEVLYGTDPNNPHSVSPTLTDSEAVSKGLVTPHTSASVPTIATGTSTPIIDQIPGVSPAPGSLTDQLGQEFLQDYTAQSQGQQLTAEQQQAIITQLMTSYGQKAARSLSSSYTLVSLHVSANTTVTTYADAVENILRNDDVPTDSSQPLPLIQAYVQNNDNSALPKLTTLGNAYAKITQDLLQVQVPPSLVQQHLALVQNFDSMAHSMKAAQNYSKDPIMVMGSLTVLPSSAQNIVDAFNAIAQVILSTGGEPAAGTPGALIVNIARSAQKPS